MVFCLLPGSFRFVFSALSVYDSRLVLYVYSCLIAAPGPSPLCRSGVVAAMNKHSFAFKK